MQSDVLSLTNPLPKLQSFQFNCSDTYLSVDVETEQPHLFSTFKSIWLETQRKQLYDQQLLQMQGQTAVA